MVKLATATTDRMAHKTTGRKAVMDYHKPDPDVLRRRAAYPWNSKRVTYLIRLIEQQPNYTYSRLAEEMNKQFKDGIRATPGIICNKLTRQVYKRRPELGKNYKWTDEKGEYLIILLTSMMSAK